MSVEKVVESTFLFIPSFLEPSLQFLSLLMFLLCEVRMYDTITTT